MRRLFVFAEALEAESGLWSDVIRAAHARCFTDENSNSGSENETHLHTVTLSNIEQEKRREKTAHISEHPVNTHTAVIKPNVGREILYFPLKVS